MWKLRWHEDKIGADGRVARGWSRSVHIGPSVGTAKLTEKEARRIGWENFLSKLDAGVCTPSSAMTIGNFVEQKFLPDHVSLLKKSGRVHYESMLKHLPASLRNQRLRDTTSADIQKLISSMLAKNYSVQTCPARPHFGQCHLHSCQAHQLAPRKESRQVSAAS